MIQLDGQILLWVQENLRSDILTPFFRFITRLGDSGMIWIVLTLLALLVPKFRKTGFLMAGALFLTLLINNMILKNLVARIRPYEVVEGLQRLLPAQLDFSFPSGHTGCSFAVGVVLLLHAPKRIGIPALILAVLIAFSRLYLGVHYLSDVLGGAVIGMGIAIVVGGIDKYVEKRKKRKN